MALGDFVDKAKDMAKDTFGGLQPEDPDGPQSAKDQANTAGRDAKQGADDLKESAGDATDNAADSAKNQADTHV
jgi:uncharacterized protein YjbJ (UPF0337 family)